MVDYLHISATVPRTVEHPPRQPDADPTPARHDHAELSGWVGEISSELGLLEGTDEYEYEYVNEHEHEHVNEHDSLADRPCCWHDRDCNADSRSKRSRKT